MPIISNDFRVDDEVSDWPLFQPWLLGYTEGVDAAFMIYKPIICVDVNFDLTVLPGQNSRNIPGVGVVENVTNLEILVVWVDFRVHDVSQVRSSKRASGFNERWELKCESIHSKG